MLIFLGSAGSCFVLGSPGTKTLHFTALLGNDRRVTPKSDLGRLEMGTEKNPQRLMPASPFPCIVASIVCEVSLNLYFDVCTANLWSAACFSIHHIHPRAPAPAGLVSLKRPGG